MPHKHKRRRDEDGDDFNLPPDSFARPLAVRRVVDSSASKSRRNKSASYRNAHADDTPKAFARLMQFGRTGKGLKGLDDGGKPNQVKKQKRNVDAITDAEVSTDAAPAQLTILPGERLKDFSARVDHALPVSGLINKGKRIEGMEERRTRHEKRLRKMQAAWREEDARMKDREAEAKELAEEEEQEQRELYGEKVYDEVVAQKKGKRRRGGKGADSDDDPWGQLERSREKPKGLHDVAQAPPQFASVPKEKFKVRNGARADVADIPAAAGSLRRREELGQTRKSIIESYRQLMAEKRSHT